MKRNKPGGLSKKSGEEPEFLYSCSRRAMGREIIYDYFRGASKKRALDFLEHRSDPGDFHYLVVMTPEGEVGRDAEGIYERGDNE